MLLVGCSGNSSPAPVLYEPHINDGGVSYFWYVSPEILADFTTQKLSSRYVEHTNFFSGSIVVHRYRGSNSTICLYKTVICDESASLFRIGDGFKMTNAVAMHSFGEVLRAIDQNLSKEVSNNSVEPTHALRAARGSP